MPPAIAAISQGADAIGRFSISASTEIAMGLVNEGSPSLSQDLPVANGAFLVANVPKSTSDDVIPPALVATLFLILGIVVFLAVMLRRMSTRPDVMQYPGQMKSQAFTYGSINLPLDDMYRVHIERRANLAKYCQHSSASAAKTRPTKFVSVSDLWKAKQSKNRREIDRIAEEPNEDELIGRFV
ncbi:Hypothetical protein NTJ_09921 [Nesidiocoris tenuis]|uniref:Uncharacterized protein n=1 Tax=Nesidiocoris tenuis TaxID=355587 RepID=A0ABN7AY73_9HEMI|nr:Hypothetical protein NTJ_09921 [Nesidiocoris tenuis]